MNGRGGQGKGAWRAEHRGEHETRGVRLPRPPRRRTCAQIFPSQLESDVDLGALGAQCTGYSGSDLHELCRIAATAAAREAMRANAEVPVSPLPGRVSVVGGCSAARCRAHPAPHGCRPSQLTLRHFAAARTAVECSVADGMSVQ